MKQRELGINAEKFEFLLISLLEITAPLVGKKKFRVIMEKDPESRNIKITYHFE